jgi:hypothetical protein
MKKWYSKITIGLMVAIMAVLCIGSAVFAASEGIQQPYYYNPDDPGFKYLNPAAKEAAIVTGYGLQSLTPKYCNVIWRYSGEVYWYPNTDAYRAASITDRQKQNVKIGPYMLTVQEALAKDPYTIPIGH